MKQFLNFILFLWGLVFSKPRIEEREAPPPPVVKEQPREEVAPAPTAARNSKFPRLRYPTLKPQDKHNVKYLLIHTTAGKPNTTPQALQSWFLRPEEKGGRGWSVGGYHWIVDGQGEAHRMYADHRRTNGTLDFHGVTNTNSLHIAYTGGRKAGEITPEQAATLLDLVHAYCAAYPNLLVLGHGQIDKRKACPNFNVPGFLLQNGFPKKSLYAHDHYGTMKRLPIPELPADYESPFLGH